MDDEDRPGSRTERVDRAIDELADRDVRAYLGRGGRIDNPPAFRRSCRQARTRDHAPKLHELATQHPDWTPGQLADAIEPPAAEPPKPAEYRPPADLPERDPQANAAAARAARAMVERPKGDAA